ncbi:(4Fe-4S)-binding protein [Streptosporangium soli]|nr:(4Fe-4S)-binding protein [Streptosporangium sp. KLBMP 9127]
MSEPLQVRADRNVCIGAGMCVMTCEEVFDQDDDGIVLLLLPTPPAEYATAVRQAVRNCPSGALTLRDE